MPMYRKVNTDFFKTWSPDMAYVLGFFAADGNMICGPRGNHYISFCSTDREILEQIKRAMGSGHKVARKRFKKRTRSPNWKTSYQIQVGSKEMFNDLLQLGMKPRKSLRLQFPSVPEETLSHFVRGYFDGDGCVSMHTYQKNDRKHPSTLLLTRFVCGSETFLSSLRARLHTQAYLRGGSLKRFGGAWRLGYSIHDSIRLYQYMYGEKREDPHLTRKRTIFEEYLDGTNE